MLLTLKPECSKRVARKQKVSCCFLVSKRKKTEMYDLRRGVQKAPYLENAGYQFEGLEFELVELKSWVLHTWILKNKAESVANWKTSPLWPVCSVYITLAGRVKESHNWHFHCAVRKWCCRKISRKSAGNLQEISSTQNVYRLLWNFRKTCKNKSHWGYAGRRKSQNIFGTCLSIKLAHQTNLPCSCMIIRPYTKLNCSSICLGAWRGRGGVCIFFCKSLLDTVSNWIKLTSWKQTKKQQVKSPRITDYKQYSAKLKGFSHSTTNQTSKKRPKAMRLTWGSRTSLESRKLRSAKYNY